MRRTHCHSKPTVDSPVPERTGRATVCKWYDGARSIVAVELQIVLGTSRCITDFEHPVVLEMSDHFLAPRLSRSQLFATCEASSLSGVYYAIRELGRPRIGVTFTRFDGTELQSDFGDGFALAAALSVFHARGYMPQSGMETYGWTEI